MGLDLVGAMRAAGSGQNNILLTGSQGALHPNGPYWDFSWVQNPKVGHGLFLLPHYEWGEALYLGGGRGRQGRGCAGVGRGRQAWLTCLISGRMTSLSHISDTLPKVIGKPLEWPRDL